MPNADLAKILEDIGPYQAAYLPVQDPEGGNATKPSDCNVPPYDETPIDPITIVPVEILKDCIVDFIPVPIVPTPYFNVDDVTNPCPSGFNFGSTIDGDGTITHGGTGVGYIIVNGSGSHFIDQIQDYSDAPNNAPWPYIEIEDGLGKAFRARVAEVINDNQLHVEGAFVADDDTTYELPGTATAYKIIRIVFTAEPDEPTFGDLFMINNPDGCGGALVGRINIRSTDIVDCPTFTITDGVGVTITMPDGTTRSIGAEVSNVACDWTVNLTAPEIIFPPYPTVPCSGAAPNVSVSDGTVGIRTYNTDGTFTDRNIELEVTGGNCSPTFSLDYPVANIEIPSLNFLVGTPDYLRFAIELVSGVYQITPSLHYLQPGTNIVDSKLFQDIRDALEDEGIGGGCSGCAVWA